MYRQLHFLTSTLALIATALVGFLIWMYPDFAAGLLDRARVFGEEGLVWLLIVVFLAALLEATFPFTLLFPGSFLLVLAVVISDNSLITQGGIWFLGTLGLLSGYTLTMVSAFGKRANTSLGTHYGGGAGTALLALTGAIPSLCSAYLFGLVVANGGVSPRVFWTLMASTPLWVLLAICIFRAVGELLINAALSPSSPVLAIFSFAVLYQAFRLFRSIAEHSTSA